MCHIGCPFEFARGTACGGDCNKPRKIKGCPGDENFEEDNAQLLYDEERKFEEERDFDREN